MPREATNETRDRLVKVAMRLFHTHGYSATGIAQVLEKAKVNSGSLYYFFPAKEKLLEAVLDRYKEVLEPAILQPVLERERDPIERVFALLQLYRDNLVRTNCKAGCPIGNLALEVADTHPAARKKIAENFEAWRLAIRQMLDDAGERLPRDVDRDKLATLVLTTMEGGVMQSRAYESVEPFDASVAMLRDYFNRLMTAAAAQTRKSITGESS
jgi:TetR/AcrR family transcriptional repressor of nem operon